MLSHKVSPREREREKSATPCAEDLDVVSVRVFQSLCCCRSSTAVQSSAHTRRSSALCHLSLRLCQDLCVCSGRRPVIRRFATHRLDWSTARHIQAWVLRRGSPALDKQRVDLMTRHIIRNDMLRVRQTLRVPARRTRTAPREELGALHGSLFFCHPTDGIACKQLAGVNDQGVFFCVL